jgi:hypothetical protein
MPAAPPVTALPSRSEQPLDRFLGALSERSNGWVARRAQARGAEIAGRSDAWIEHRLEEVAAALEHAPSKAEVLSAWQHGRAAWALAVCGETDLPDHHRELLGEWRAERLMGDARRARARLDGRPAAFVAQGQRRPPASLASLDDHQLAWAAKYAALRHEQLARAEYRRLSDRDAPGAGLSGSELLLAERSAAGSVGQLVERCALAIGSERQALAVAHSAALTPEMARLQPSVLVAYARSLRARLGRARRSATMALTVLDREYRVADDLHAWCSAAAEAAAAAATDPGLRRSERERRELQQLATVQRSRASRMEAGLADAADELREARRQHTHPDNSTDQFARLIAAEVAIGRLLGLDVDSQLARDDGAHELRRSPRARAADGPGFER